MSGVLDRSSILAKTAVMMNRPLLYFPFTRTCVPILPVILSFAALSLLAASCASFPREALYPGTRALLPGVEPGMNSPGYWIALHPDPDGLLLDGEGVAALNASIRGQRLTRDLGMVSERSGAELAGEFTDTLSWIARARVYQRNGKRVNEAFLAPLRQAQNAEALPGTIAYRYGFLVRRTDIRALPTNEPLYDGPGDPYIDNLQASSLEWGTPLLVMHRSADGSWLYAVTELVSGWVPTSDVAFAEPDDFFALYRRGDPLVVTSARADLFGDEDKTAFLGYARMGSLLYEDGQIDDRPRSGVTRVTMPARDETGALTGMTAWVDTRDVSNGFLPYTPRNIYQQAFRLLHAPYGWGGSFGERDCSQFLCEIFSTFGIVLPRNSAKQARVGKPVEGFSPDSPDSSKKDLLENGAIPGATLLRFPGHIMLYLGSVRGEPYVIHSTWGYRERRGRSDIVRLVNRVAVSTLDLGAGSDLESHVRRLTAASIVTLPATDGGM